VQSNISTELNYPATFSPRACLFDSLFGCQKYFDNITSALKLKADHKYIFKWFSSVQSVTDVRKTVQ